MNGSHFRSCALRFLLVAGLLALAGLAIRPVQGAALAQSADGAWALLSAGYGLSWWTVDGGGYTFSGDGDYAVGGTVGQPDAGVMSDGGGTYTLRGGFWGGAGPVEHRIYLPLVFRGY